MQWADAWVGYGSAGGWFPGRKWRGSISRVPRAESLADNPPFLAFTLESPKQTRATKLQSDADSPQLFRNCTSVGDECVFRPEISANSKDFALPNSSRFNTYDLRVTKSYFVFFAIIHRCDSNLDRLFIQNLRLIKPLTTKLWPIIVT